MANAWNRNKVDSSTINNGNEYEKGDRVSRQNLNAMVNAGLYAQDFAEKLVTNIDTSEIGNVGTPSIVLVDGDGATTNKPYKKFKFSNLKGDKGETGDKGDTIELRVSDGYFQWKYTQDTAWKNLIATSEISNVDQILSDTSTNAIANKTVKEEFNNVVYKTDFDKSSSTSFGDYIIRKRIVVYDNESGVGTNASTPERVISNLKTRLNEGDYIEIIFSLQGAGMSFGKTIYSIDGLRLGFAYHLDQQKYYGKDSNNFGIYNADASITFNSNSITIATGTSVKYSSDKTVGSNLSLDTIGSAPIFNLFQVNKVIGVHPPLSIDL